MLLPIHNVLLIILITWSSPVSSQVQDLVNSLNSCADNCINRSSAFVGCAAGDISCRCSHQAAIIGPDKKPSPEGGCIFKACGRKNATGEL